MMTSLPVIDISCLRNSGSVEAVDRVSREIGDACRRWGFFYISNHGVEEELQRKLEVSVVKDGWICLDKRVYPAQECSHAFFDLDPAEKGKIAMPLAGKAWRGYFPVGDEVTSGIVDQKEVRKQHCYRADGPAPVS